MSRRLFIVTLACRAADPLVASNGAGEEYLWSIVKAGGYVIFIRHALTDQGVGDPPGFNLKNCDTQRNRYRATDEHQFDKKNPQVTTTSTSSSSGLTDGPLPPGVCCSIGCSSRLLSQSQSLIQWLPTTSNNV